MKWWLASEARLRERERERKRGRSPFFTGSGDRMRKNKRQITSRMVHPQLVLEPLVWDRPPLQYPSTQILKIKRQRRRDGQKKCLEESWSLTRVRSMGVKRVQSFFFFFLDLVGQNWIDSWKLSNHSDQRDY